MSVSGGGVQLIRDGGEGESEEDVGTSTACCLPCVSTPY